jgi:cyclopropane-fatty-acyl-phospholipid synthase
MADSVLTRKAAVLKNIFQGYEGPAFAVRLWDGWQWSSSTNDKTICTLSIANPKTLASLVATPDEVSLGEAFIRGDLDVDGDLFSAFQIAEHLFNRPRTPARQIAQRTAAIAFGLEQWFRHGALNSKKRDRASISYHYDLPVDFYEPWLGNTLAYSCAYFNNSNDALDAAQQQKLDLVCRKLRLKAGEHFLDIGCGWGSLVLHAACRHHAKAEGLTLSREQAAVGKRRIDAANMRDCCNIELRDYRELDSAGQAYDKMASIGMFEHVGLKNLPLYFGIAYRILRPGGLFLNHGIARTDLSPMRSRSFIGQYVFPDGQLVTLSQALAAAESRGFEVRDVENLREHYDLTLRQWVERLRQHAETLLQHVPNTTYRIWLLYMAGSAAAFRRGDIAVYQTLLSSPDKGKSDVPLTRADLYSARPVQRQA